MARFQDPTLFPGDLIADYFQAVAPAGYKLIYWIFAKVGVGPLVAAKILPALIGLATAWLAFQIYLQLRASARGAFLASAILTQLIWLNDDVVSATPRAFVYPLFLGFLLGLIRKNLPLCLGFLALEGLIYPQAALFSAALLGLGLFHWERGRPEFSRERWDYVLALGGGIVLALVLSPFGNSVSAFGPVIERDAAMQLPEFLRGGRSEFFTGGSAFWLNGARSGFFPKAIPLLYLLSACGGAIFAIGTLKPSSRARFFQLAVVALALWSLAHLFLFHLHLPARYSQWALRIVIALLAALALDLLIARWRTLAAVGCFLLLLSPHLRQELPHRAHSMARPRELYDFLRTLPKGAVIATLTKQGDNIPAIAQRRVFVSAEHAIPYHERYYREIRQRGRDLVHAHYTADEAELRSFIEGNSIDYLLLEPGCFTLEYLKDRRWFRDIAPQLPPGNAPALAGKIEGSKIWEGDGFVVLDARRL